MPTLYTFPNALVHHLHAPAHHLPGPCGIVRRMGNGGRRDKLSQLPSHAMQLDDGEDSTSPQFCSGTATRSTTVASLESSGGRAIRYSV